MRLAGLILVALLEWSTSRAQPCERLDIQGKKQQKSLKRFIHECNLKGFLTPDSGYIYLSEWIDKQGQLNWQVAALRNWQPYPWIAPFLDHCNQCIAPVGWTKVANRLIVRYRYDQSSDTLTKAQSTCLQNIVANYVTILPALLVPPKMVPVLDPKGQPILDKEGKPKMQKYMWNTYGGNNGGHNTHITFKKDGSIEKGLSL
ncbi:hypothetical protein [Spirosoma endophyticum]|uniref:Uncharacterized protein n=1 Tax=Spirosoma endophyticum TaxID=662367 RepID=A0A1I2HYH3_9BACT|nr:hypothetical protein [Spirosoma endophyticum]SFF34493.1 hypothetical protein SAMN05216167_1515 [Spirosoma endophyticum]